MESQTTPNPPPKATRTIAIVVAWTVVSIPLLWGVSQTLIQSLNLFRK
ncbi:MAG: hypothetical protein JWL69_764 [Phycisphaerales bacterium]|jgi:hypothetical protein|nr:hypothetical protein [Phycisphaerales bacterium]